jgi:L,D-transpeptidase ErfK/SrfK
MLLIGLLPGCALWNHDIEQETPRQKTVVDAEPHNFLLDGQNSVIGRLASVPLQDGDTLLDIARHFGLGYQHITEANPNLDPWVPQQDARAILPLQFILPDAPRKGVVINLASMRLFYYPEGKQTMFSTWPIGIGKEGRSTPVGVMAIQRKKERPTWYVPASIRRTHEQQGDPLPAVVPPGPDNPLGDYAFYLSKPSYLIHGTNKPFSIGLRASNGCIRLYPEDITLAFREIPPQTAVRVVNQPYLLGWLDGQLYLEAHQPYEELDAKHEKKKLLVELQRIAKSQPHKLDWPKIEETIEHARGIPTPIFGQSESLEQRLVKAIQLGRPAQLAGQAKPSEPVVNGWLLRTAETFDEYRARKLAAQLNHLGPRIPAVTVAGNQGYHVIAGPFIQERVARKAQLMLNIDFETKSELIKPTKS